MPAVSKGDGMRGLAVFISDIRNCELPFCMLLHHVLFHCVVKADMANLVAGDRLMHHAALSCGNLDAESCIYFKKISFVTFSGTINMISYALTVT